MFQDSHTSFVSNTILSASQIDSQQLALSLREIDSGYFETFENMILHNVRDT